jgi:hypothetical protein
MSMRARTPLLISTLTILIGSGAVFAEDISVWSSTTVEYDSNSAEPMVHHESATWSDGQLIQGDDSFQATFPQAADILFYYEAQQSSSLEQQTVMTDAQIHESQVPSYGDQPSSVDFDTSSRQASSPFGTETNTLLQTWAWDPVFHPVEQVPQKSIYLNGLHETPPLETRGYGIARIWFQEDALHYSIDVHDLSSPITSAHFHRGASGVKGPVAQPITFNGMHAEGVWHLNEQDARDVLSGQIYVNVHTERYPDGELRGQL